MDMGNYVCIFGKQISETGLILEVQTDIYSWSNEEVIECNMSLLQYTLLHNYDDHCDVFP